MVIVQLAGGLGNQLFQYAAGRALAYHNQVPLFLDLTSFERDPKRQYRLDHFDIRARVASQSDMDRVLGWGAKGIPTRMRQWLHPNAPYFERTVFAEQYHPYDPNFWKAPKTVYLEGYWQTERYFAHIRELLQSELVVLHTPDKQNRTMLERIAQVESVGVHVRRGDYVSDFEVKRVHGVCPLSYYSNAIDVMARRLPNPHFFIFSDDMDWSIANLNVEYPCTYVAHNTAEQDYEDLRLMSRCKHLIIANSSFSWWGAWLSTHPSKIIIAPSKWFNQSDRNTRDVVPTSWLTLGTV